MNTQFMISSEEHPVDHQAEFRARMPNHQLQTLPDVQFLPSTKKHISD